MDKLSQIKKSSHIIYKSLELIFNLPLINFIKGFMVKYFFFPFAEKYEKRNIRKKIKINKVYYQQNFSKRKKLQINNLIDTLQFAEKEIPFYKDLFKKIKFDPLSLNKDINFFKKIPILTKETILNNFDRLYTQNKQVFYSAKTGGSTGISINVLYDKFAADCASAITFFSRQSIGKDLDKSELHFASKFPDEAYQSRPNREDFKCLSLNRTNIFFNSLNDSDLFDIYYTLKRRRPFLIHAHPSTIYLLALFVSKHNLNKNLFDIFESSGELLTENVEKTISKNLQCKVINRYGLAEFGVVAYQRFKNSNKLYIYDSDIFAEDDLVYKNNEIILTSLKNRLMPLIRYRTGDFGKINEDNNGFYISNLYGRVHDTVTIGNNTYLTHHLQDILDHHVLNIKQFQIDSRATIPILLLCLKNNLDKDDAENKLKKLFGNSLSIKFVGMNEFIKTGSRSKFRYIIS